MFEAHKLNEQGVKAMNEFKTKLSLVISETMAKMPEGRNKSIFKTKIDEAVFFGAKAIAEHPENFTEVMNYPEFENLY